MDQIGTYSEAFAQTIRSIYGSQGSDWLAQLPTLVEQCAQQWQLTDLRPYKHLTYNYVLSGSQQNIPIVLKLRCTMGELNKEVAALQAFAHHGCVQVLAYDTTLNAVLLERAIPGDALNSYVPHNDIQATHIAADLIQKIHQAEIPPAHNFPLLEHILPNFEKEFADLAPFLARARVLKEHLLATQDNNVLLHGDFHHGNILSTRDNTWKAIDPEGIIGNQLYDLAVFIRNPLKELVVTPQASDLIATRIRDFAQLLGHSAQRIYEWTYVQAVASAYWSLEDGLIIDNHVKFLELLQKVHDKKIF